jgi:hypothetical protein
MKNIQNKVLIELTNVFPVATLAQTFVIKDSKNRTISFFDKNIFYSVRSAKMCVRKLIAFIFDSNQIKSSSYKDLIDDFSIFPDLEELFAEYEKLNYANKKKYIFDLTALMFKKEILKIEQI